ncbi:hypothetical protein [uncultured Sulfitobacter sp.]|nr:hypothetical protein [uncultured Sulfitobacter sp.]
MPKFGPQFGGTMVDNVSTSGDIIPTPKALIDLARYCESIQQ